MATIYSDYNPAGATRTSKFGVIRPIPLFPDWQNHIWFERFQMDFVNKNIVENNGVISGCIVSGDGIDTITPTGGEAYINGQKISVPTPGVFEVTQDGWQIIYVTNTGAILYGALINTDVQNAVTPEDAVVIGYSVKGNGVFNVYSFPNKAKDVAESVSWGYLDQVVTEKTANFYTDGSGDPLDKDANPYVINEDSEILILHNVPAVANLSINAGVKKVSFKMSPGLTLDMSTFDLNLGEAGDSISGQVRVTGTGVLTAQRPTSFEIENDNMSVVSNKGAASGIVFTNQEYLVQGTQTQVNNGDAHFYLDAVTGNPKNKAGNDFALEDDDEIRIRHNAALAANLIFQPLSSKILNVKMYKGVSLDTGDAGSGEPFKVILEDNIASGSKIKLRGIQEFSGIPFALTDDQKRFISNHAVGVKVQYNEDLIYDPSNVGNIITKLSWPSNPYLVRANGQQLYYRVHQTVPATNDTLAWFRDLNKYENGYRDGSEVASRHTLPAVIAANPHLFQVNTPNGMMRDISTVDPDIHARTDSNGVSIAATVDFVNSSSTVTIQTTVGNIKNFMRLNGASAQGIPDGVSGTTILIDIDETARTATMVDALTFAPVAATSTVNGIAATIDNSGAAGGSLQVDAFQGHFQEFNFTRTLQCAIGAAVDSYGSTVDSSIDVLGPITDGVNGTPRTTSVTRDNSTDVYIFQQA